MARPRKNKVLKEDKNTKGQNMEKEFVTMDKELENLQTEKDLMMLELEKTKKELEETKLAIKNTPARAYDKEELEISEKQIARSSEGKAIEAKIAAQKEYDNQKVTGKFINRRAPGQPVKLPYIKYADDPVKWWPFEDGKVYTIPRGFADQIREHYHVPRFIQTQGAMDPNQPSSQIADVDTSNKKYDFVPINF